MFIKLVGLLVILVSGFFLISRSIEDGNEVLNPAELLKRDKASFVRVVGTVKNLKIRHFGDTFDFEFDLVGDDGTAVKTVYSGFKPELLQDGISAMVNGDLQNGVLVASSVMTQCPSKYEPESQR
ncbi:MAG: cytochrome c maturation protein CcmE [Deltaproteobacteria bacterium]|nr:cytochrome c maturation protein CcmE [Deltaproteobacteria bacterium]